MKRIKKKKNPLIIIGLLVSIFFNIYILNLLVSNLILMKI